MVKVQQYLHCDILSYAMQYIIVLYRLQQFEIIFLL